MILLLAAALIVVNVWFGVLAGRSAGEALLSPHGESSEDLILAASAGPGQVLAADNANNLMFYGGDPMVRRVPFPALIGGLAASADGNTVYAGSSDGRVVTMDPSLQATSEFQVGGRVVGLAATAGGDLVVAYGQGANSGQFFVSRFAAGAEAPLFERHVEFTLTALAASGDEVLFGTQNARVGKVDAQGTTLWVTRLGQPVTRLLGLPDGGVIAGGDQGQLTRLSSSGDVIAETTLGKYPIRGIGYDASSATVFAGDANGSLFAVDQGGQVVVRRDVSSRDLEAVIPAGDGTIVLVPRTGPWSTLRPDAINVTQSAERLRFVWLAIDAGLLVALLGAAIAAVDRLNRGIRRTARAVVRARLAYLFLVPTVLFVVCFSYYPAGMAIYYSFTNFSLRNPTEFVGFQNYVDVLAHDRYFRTGTTNLVIIVVTSVLKTITVPLLAAELVFWLKRASHRYIFRTLFVLSAVVPDLVSTLMWRQVFDPYTGLLNQLLGAVGLGRWERAWLGDERTALWAVIGVGFPFVSAFSFLIFLGGLLTINRDYFDAARVDGADRWDRFRYIDLPLLLPQMRILLFFAVTGAVQGFAAVFILTRGGPGTATYVPALQMYRRIGEGDFGYASAIGVVLFGVVLVLTLIVLLFRRQEAIEGG